MLNVKDILYELSEDKNVYNDDFDLIESGVLDSYVFIELFSILEDNGIEIQPTRITKEELRTPKSIENLIKKYM